MNGCICFGFGKKMKPLNEKVKVMQITLHQYFNVSQPLQGRQSIG